MKCADEGLKMARKDGFEWLMHIDTDEFALAENNPSGNFGKLLSPFQSNKRSASLDRGHLPQMLSRVRKKTAQIILETREVIPLVTDAEIPFWKLHYFHSGIHDRKIQDPITREVKPVPWFGHKIGKSIVRTEMDVQAASSHRWTRKQNRALPDLFHLPSEKKGYVYHFCFTSLANWQKKFQKHSYFPKKYSDVYTAPFPKQSWKEASVKMSNEEAERYYNDWLVVPRDKLKKYLEEGSIIRKTIVEDVLRESGWIDL
jgi:hypothetical protein